jgi:hypothetical protein
LIELWLLAILRRLLAILRRLLAILRLLHRRLACIASWLAAVRWRLLLSVPKLLSHRRLSSILTAPISLLGIRHDQ